MRNRKFFFLLISIFMVSVLPAYSSESLSDDLKVVSYFNNELSDEEMDIALNYTRESNKIRDKVISTMGWPESSEKDAEMLALSRQVHQLDEDMRPILEKYIRSGYWNGVNDRNSELDLAMWLALQHVFDVDLVEIMLPQLLVLVKSNVAPGKWYALMYDRLAITEGRMQKFGSQTKCINGTWTTLPLENPEEVEKYRAEFGFKTTLVTEQDSYGKRKC